MTKGGECAREWWSNGIQKYEHHTGSLPLKRATDCVSISPPDRPLVRDPKRWPSLQHVLISYKWNGSQIKDFDVALLLSVSPQVVAL